MTPEDIPTQDFRKSEGLGHDVTESNGIEALALDREDDSRRGEFTLGPSDAPELTSTGELGSTIGVEPRLNHTPPRARFLGGYEIGEELARGGMGIVYRAWQVNLTRWVALKLVRDPSLATYADMRRFRVEAEAVAQLDHPNIVPIYEVGQTDVQPYFSMKLINGGNLTSSIARLKTAPREGAALMVKVARAIHYAHQHAILHRDIKPSNILLGDHDEPFVADFGLAKRIDSATGVADTVTGTVMGTPAYMPPEQAGGGTKSLTTAADIYSLGATFYEILTGRAPFSGETAAIILRRVLDEEPTRPRSIIPTLDPDLETICLKCLEKKPLKRYGSAEDLADDLQRWLDHRPIAARPTKTWERVVKWVRRKPTMASLISVSIVALLGLVIGGGWFTISLAIALDTAIREGYSSDMNLARQAFDNNEVYRVREYLDKYRETKHSIDTYRSFEWYYLWNLCNPRRTLLAGHSREVLAITYSPDGRQLASGGEDATIRLWHPEQGKTQFVLKGHQATVLALDFRHDGKLLASGSRDKTIRLWNTATGQCTKILQIARTATCIAFSPDGKSIAFSTAEIEDRVLVWDVEQSRELDSLSTLTGVAEQPAFGTPNVVKFSRDGKRLFVTDNNGSGFAVWDLKTKGLIRVPFGLHLRSLCLSGDRRSLITLSASQNIKLWDAETLKEIDFPALGGAGAFQNAIVVSSSSPVGELLANTNFVTNTIEIWNLDKRRRIDFLASEVVKGQQSLALRPDGRRLAIAHKDQVIVVPLVTLESTPPLVSMPTSKINAFAVRFDQKRLAWSASGDPNIIIWDPLLQKPAHSLKGHGIGVSAVAYGPPTKPDLLASAGEDGAIRIWNSATDGPALQVLNGHMGEVRDLAILPDGQTLVSAGSDGTIRVWDINAGALSRVINPDAGPLLALAVSPDGHYVAAACGNQSLGVWKIKTGGHALGPIALQGMPTDVAFSPDGRRITAGGSKIGSGGFVSVFTVGGSLLSEWDTPSAVRTLAFSDDGRRVITGSTDGSLLLWDTVTGRETIALEGHKQAVLALVVTSGLELYSAGSDGTIKLWEGLDPGPLKVKPAATKERHVMSLPSP